MYNETESESETSLRSRDSLFRVRDERLGKFCSVSAKESLLEIEKNFVLRDGMEAQPLDEFKPIKREIVPLIPQPVLTQPRA